MQTCAPTMVRALNSMHVWRHCGSRVSQKARGSGAAVWGDRSCGFSLNLLLRPQAPCSRGYQRIGLFGHQRPSYLLGSGCRPVVSFTSTATLSPRTASIDALAWTNTFALLNCGSRAFGRIKGSAERSLKGTTSGFEAQDRSETNWS